MKSFAAFALLSSLLFTGTAHAAQEMVSLQAPVQSKNGPYTVNAILIRDSAIQNQPLVVISHGTPSENETMQLEMYIEQAKVFANAGFMALIVERRGHGRSTENPAEIGGKDCDNRNYLVSAAAGTNDIIGTVAYLKSQDAYKFDVNRILLVGYSSGGFASLAAGASKDFPIRAVVNISGGRGKRPNQEGLCSQDNMMSTLKTIGERYANKGSVTPTLWLTVANDKTFSPDLSNQMFQAFKSGSNGKDSIEAISNFQKGNGHIMFREQAGIQFWAPVVKSFLDSISF